ncbi:MAG: glycerol-3-phosphate dehydrogenase [Rhodospirillaceae bacterium]|nr:glycerol-3-phosphate dehydrogenase [Rhodospirillaceae bacterium]
MPENGKIHDLTVVGGGINGVGIARDAAGRGLSVLLVEAGDLAGGTSSASSKLIHGGLRYLEHGQLRLVRDALREREVLMANAPHLVQPLRFVLPHVPAMRPRPLIRLGLFLYDHLARRRAIPGSTGVDLSSSPLGAPLRRKYSRGFSYWDCWVDDARLVTINARAAAERGAEILTRTSCVAADRLEGRWRLRLRDEASGEALEARARALVNAAGPWVGRVADSIDTGSAVAAGPRIRLVKGSHIVVPRIVGADAAYILQNDDRRVVFLLPFEDRFSLIGTTDVPFEGDAGGIAIDAAETQYLIAAVSGFLKRPPAASDVVWSFSGVRPLYEDDKSAPASAVTRNYRLELEGGANRPPLLTVLGGKLTTYRRLAEDALDRLAPHLAIAGRPWTASAPLPGGDLPASDVAAFVDDLAHRYDRFDRAYLVRLVRRHGRIAEDVLGDARSPQDMGRHVGADLYEREVLHMAANEWARRPEDVLWRRTKTGVHLSTAKREAAAEALAGML